MPGCVVDLLAPGTQAHWDRSVVAVGRETIGVGVAVAEEDEDDDVVVLVVVLVVVVVDVVLEVVELLEALDEQVTAGMPLHEVVTTALVGLNGSAE